MFLSDIFILAIFDKGPVHAVERVALNKREVVCDPVVGFGSRGVDL